MKPARDDARGLALILGAVALAYANALTAAFQFDDWNVIVHEPGVHSIAAWWASMPGIRPLLKLSYALNDVVSSGPFSFHLVNVAIHGANACLVFALLVRRASRTLALSTALLFALHPVQTEAVTYASGRSSSLSALFVLFALYARERFSSAFFAAALLVKETAIAAVVPLVMRTRSGVAIAVALCAAVAALASPAYRHLLQVSLHLRSIGANLLTQAHAIVYLIGQLVRFDRLNADPKLPVIAAWNASVALEAAGVLALIALGVVLAKRGFRSGTAILWFFLWLLPTNSFLPRLDVANDRQLYLAMLGPAWLVAHGLWLAAKQRPALTWAVTVVLAIGLGWATHVRNRVYADELSFWSDVVAKTPHNARAFNNRGFALVSAHRPEEAERDFETALTLDPRYVQAAVNLRLLREGALDPNAVRR